MRSKQTERKPNFRGSLWASAAAIAVTGIITPHSFAQDAEATSAEENANDDARRLTTVTVTSRKREESILEVPASVALIDAAELDKQGIVDFEDLAFAVPNVLITENANLAGRTGVTIRGIPGRAGIYVDDIFVGDSAGINTLLVDIEAVEVLRGPQGTFFGRNAMSGAINTVTKKPGDEFTATVDTQIGEYGLFSARGSINGPIAEGVSGKISAGYRVRDTYDEVRNQGTLKAEDAQMIAGQLKFEPLSNIEILLNADYLEETSENPGNDVVRDFGFPGSIYGIAATDGDPNDRVHPGQNVVNSADREMLNLWGRVDVDLNFATFTSITNQREIDFLFNRDGENSDFDYIRGVQPVDFEQFSQEFRLTSTDEGDFDWMLGVYYFDSERSDEDANTIGGDAVLTVDPGFAPFIPAFFPGGTAGVVTPNTLVANPFLAPFDPSGALGFILGELTASGTTDVGTTTTATKSTIESTAFWATGTYRPTDQFELTAGIRYTDETLGGSFSSAVTGNILPLFGVVAFDTVTLPDRGDDNVSVNVSGSYYPNENLTLYGSFSQGFRSGGYNLAPGGIPGTPAEEAANRAFDSEKVDSFEIGFKSVLFDGTATLNAAAFTSSYTDFQRGFLRSTPTGFINETLNTDASIDGVEIDFLTQLTDELSVSASYGYQKSEYDDYPDAPINSTAGLQVVDLTGEPLPFVPENSFALGFNYETPVFGNWNARVTTDVQYRSSYIVTDTDGVDPEAEVDDTVIVNPSIGLTNDNGLQIILRANNVFDEEFSTGVDFNTFDGTVARSLSAPRVVSLQIRKDF